VENGDRWKVENKPARDVMQNQLAEASAPARVSRTMAVAGATAGSGSAAPGRQSTIIYDRTERKFVNSDAPRSTAPNATENAGNANGTSSTNSSASQQQSQAQGQAQGKAQVRIYPDPNKAGDRAPVPPSSNRMAGREGATAAVPSARSATPVPARPAVVPPSVPRAVTSERAFSESGARGGGNARGGSAAPSASAPAAAPRASAPAPSAPAAGSSGGGRPH